jgi:hypothetical protein
MTDKELCDAALLELAAIERGTATVKLVAGDPLIGDVHYRSSNGWVFVVFSDGGEWDYIDRIQAPSGEELKVWPDAAKAGSPGLIALVNYRPPGGQSRTIWGFMD